jgi:membrane protein YqaA with SNARE-associated domain
MFEALILAPKSGHPRSLASTLRHLGAAGLFILAVLDSTPIPTFGGPDILLAVLAGRHRDIWFEYAGLATLGSVLGAYMTFHLSRKAGEAYLTRKFGAGKAATIERLFHRWGSGALAASAAIPFPFPTSMLFAVAGASSYRTSRFVAIVALCRALRYSAIALCAVYYGRHFLRVLRHPMQYWPWFLVVAVMGAGLVATAIVVNRRLSEAAAD